MPSLRQSQKPRAAAIVTLGTATQFPRSGPPRINLLHEWEQSATHYHREKRDQIRAPRAIWKVRQAPVGAPVTTWDRVTVAVDRHIGPTTAPARRTAWRSPVSTDVWACLGQDRSGEHERRNNQPVSIADVSRITAGGSTRNEFWFAPATTHSATLHHF